MSTIHAALALRRHPGFTAAAVITLALGIGATTAVFSVVYGVLIKPLPYPDADELVSLRHTARGLAVNLGLGADDAFGLSESMYVTYSKENSAFEHVGLWTLMEQTLTGVGEPEQIRVLQVTHGTLQALGVQPVLGRWFSDAEHTLGSEGAAPVIVSHAFWQRRFGGDEAALGRTLSLDFHAAQVVGIMPADFRFLDQPQPDVISAIRTDGNQILMSYTTRGVPYALGLGPPNYSGIARLKNGVTLAEANTDMARMLAIWLDAWPPGRWSREAVADWQFAPAVRPLKDDVVGGVGEMLWLLMGAVGAVLLIACANIANLLLARAHARRHELAIRAALGAGRARIAGELLRESFVLGALGGVVGLGLAYVGLELLSAIAPPNLPRVEDISVGAPVLAFAIAAALVSSLAFGSIPAIKHAYRSDTLGTSPRGASGSLERHRARSVLIVAQVALALVLLVCAGLMIRTFQALSAVDPGFSGPGSVQVASIFIPFAAIPEPERYTRVYREALDRIAALPGVTAAGFGGGVPLDSNMAFRGRISVEDRPDVAEGSPATRRFMSVTPGYFEALGTRLVAGRDLTWPDIDDARAVALVSENVARELWGDPQAALGKRIRPEAYGPGPWREIIGVTQDVRGEGLHEPPPPIVYTPLIAQGTDLRGVTYVIRSARTGTESFANEVRQAVWASHPDIVISMGTMQEFYSAALARTSFVLVLLAVAGTMAVVLSVVGIYGVISYMVSQRTREIGIRLALGAEQPAVKRMFVLHGLGVAAVGVAAGLAGAVALSRWMSSLLFEVRPVDPATYVAVVVLLLAAVWLAAYLPARRAARLDPAATLRAE
jgi:predicted permease